MAQHDSDLYITILSNNGYILYINNVSSTKYTSADGQLHKYGYATLDIYPDTGYTPVVIKNNKDVTADLVEQSTTNSYKITVGKVANAGNTVTVDFKLLPKPKIKVEQPVAFSKIFITKSDGTVVDVTSKLLT